MAIIPKIKVKLKSSKNMTVFINKSDYDPDLHAKLSKSVDKRIAAQTKEAIVKPNKEKNLIIDEK